MDVISLASGMGVLDYAMRDAGMSIKLQCECGPEQLEVLNVLFPESIKDKDIFKLTWEKINETYKIKNTKDMSIIGGLCCTPFSYEGKRAGKKSKTWMCKQLARLTHDCQPRWVLVENVDGFLDHADGYAYLATRMANIGYLQWGLDFPASALGAPHQRNRVFILFSRDAILAHTIGQRRLINERPSLPVLPTVIPGFWNNKSVPESRGLGLAYGTPSNAEKAALRCLGNAVVYPVGLLVGRCLTAINDYFYESDTGKQLDKMPWSEVKEKYPELYYQELQLHRIA